jgi:16S rRNA (guanine527-N7)-methyltransferase
VTVLVGTAAEALSLAGIPNVSRETLDRLNAFVALLARWQARTNLIAQSTRADVWRRHVADSAQLAALFPEARIWLDLGSGAGFPGMVLAIIEAEKGGAVHLVESDAKKGAFLREAIRTTSAPATVHQGRIEVLLPQLNAPIDILTARALAPLNRLLEFATLVPIPVRMAFPKGRDHRREVDEASKSWDFDLVKHKSKVEDDAVILEVTRLTAR